MVVAVVVSSRLPLFMLSVSFARVSIDESRCCLRGDLRGHANTSSSTCTFLGLVDTAVTSHHTSIICCRRANSLTLSTCNRVNMRNTARLISHQPPHFSVIDQRVLSFRNVVLQFLRVPSCGHDCSWIRTVLTTARDPQFGG